MAVRNVLRTREDGVLLGGPPCGSWIFVNSGTHQRKLAGSIWGNTALSYVRDANTTLACVK